MDASVQDLAMELRSRQQVYSQALRRWGRNTQILLAIEEMGELTQVLAKFLNGRLGEVGHSDLLSELADMQIMIEQLAYQIDPDGVESKVIQKVERLKQRLLHDRQTTKGAQELQEEK